MPAASSTSSENHNKDCSLWGVSKDLAWEPRLGLTFINAPQRAYSDRLRSQYMVRQFRLYRTGICSKTQQSPHQKFTGTAPLRLALWYLHNLLHKEAQSIIKDTSHPAPTLSSPLPSGKRYRSIKSHATHFRGSSSPQVAGIMNIALKHAQADPLQLCLGSGKSSLFLKALSSKAQKSYFNTHIDIFFWNNNKKKERKRWKQN